MNDKKGYDLVSRPAGGMQLVASVCEDGYVHVFGHIDGRTYKRPACGAHVPFGKPAEGAEPMCLGCAGRAEAWAMGGALMAGSGETS